MTPTQLQGLQVCFCFTASMVAMAPLLVWVLPNRQAA